MPIETDICVSALELSKDGVPEFHGYELAKRLAETCDRQSLAAYGTLYRALARLVDMGMLKSRWENPQTAAIENRPRRRFYSLTPLGRTAVRDALASRTVPAKRLRKGWAPA